MKKCNLAADGVGHPAHDNFGWGLSGSLKRWNTLLANLHRSVLHLTCAVHLPLNLSALLMWSIMHTGEESGCLTSFPFAKGCAPHSWRFSQRMNMTSVQCSCKHGLGKNKEGELGAQTEFGSRWFLERLSEIPQNSREGKGRTRISILCACVSEWEKRGPEQKAGNLFPLFCCAPANKAKRVSLAPPRKLTTCFQSSMVPFPNLWFAGQANCYSNCREYIYAYLFQAETTIPKSIWAAFLCCVVCTLQHRHRWKIKHVLRICTCRCLVFHFHWHGYSLLEGFQSSSPFPDWCWCRS